MNCLTHERMYGTVTLTLKTKTNYGQWLHTTHNSDPTLFTPVRGLRMILSPRILFVLRGRGPTPDGWGRFAFPGRVRR